MTTRDTFQEKTEAQLKALDARIQLLEAKAEQLEAEAKIEFEKQIKDLRDRREQVQKRLDQLKKAGTTAWQDLKKGVDTALNDLEKAIVNAANRFE
jgi:TolA-binding protein